ncbi:MULTISPECIES: hypothetical protein [Clostridium]|uniref:hypothetical protein n=1 Tax=Clostridium TaxID=1485 RepID=UPI0018A11FB3|nr:hypothetical protein [Clostridium tyrobutyricum]
MNNLNEAKIIEFLLLKVEKEGSVSLSELKKAIRESFELTEHDLSISPTRPSELRYEQRIRNIIVNGNLPTNIKYENGVYTLIK